MNIQLFILLWLILGVITFGVATSPWYAKYYEEADIHERPISWLIMVLCASPFFAIALLIDIGRIMFGYVKPRK